MGIKLWEIIIFSISDGSMTQNLGRKITWLSFSKSSVFNMFSVHFRFQTVCQIVTCPSDVIHDRHGTFDRHGLYRASVCFSLRKIKSAFTDARRTHLREWFVPPRVNTYCIREKVMADNEELVPLLPERNVGCFNPSKGLENYTLISKNPGHNSSVEV